MVSEEKVINTMAVWNKNPPSPVGNRVNTLTSDRKKSINIYVKTNHYINVHSSLILIGAKLIQNITSAIHARNHKESVGGALTEKLIGTFTFKEARTGK